MYTVRISRKEAQSVIKANELRGKIMTKYKSIGRCADDIGMSRSVLYRIINQEKLPNSDEISRIGHACEMSSEEIRSIFLA